MGRNSHYWDNKTERSKVAKEHNELMKKIKAENIAQCIKGSKVYNGKDFCDYSEESESNIIKHKVKDDDSVSAVMSLLRTDREKKTAVLNFASFKNPGGGFLKGSSAQEESLCHKSTLYPVLEDFDTSFYAYNREHLNKGLYEDRAIYTPDVYFKTGMYERYCDVITCAAPNLSVAVDLCRLNIADCEEALEKRAEFIKHIAEENGVQVLVLGAYGCGVFKWDAKTVAEVFKRVFYKSSCIEKVVHPVPVGINKYNYIAFKEVFG